MSKNNMSENKYIPRNYQLEGRKKQIKALQQFGGCINGSEPGTGKTCQALITLSKTKLPVLIICPATLKYNWERELTFWLRFNYTYTILSGSPNKDSINEAKNSDIVIINYDILMNKNFAVNKDDDLKTRKRKALYNKKPHWYQILKKIKFKIMIADEAHALKNSKAKRTKTVKDMVSTIDYLMFLTATPITSRPTDIFPLLQMIDYNSFPSFRKFASTYCIASKGWKGKTEYKEAKDTKSLYKILNPYMIRYRKKDILKELPPKIFTNIEFDIDNRKEYDLCAKGLAKYVDGKIKTPQDKINALNTLVQMRQASAKGKLKQTIQWIENFLEGSDEKLVIMGIHKEPLNQIEKHFKKICVKITGDVAVSKRQGLVDKFQNDKNCRLFVGNLKSASCGITLTSACNLAFFELSYIPADVVQATDRVHRISQEANVVSIFYLLGRNTIDIKLAEVNDSKKIMANEIVDGEETPVQELINYIK